MIFADGTDKVAEIEKYWEDEDNDDEIDKMTEANDTPILVTYEKSGDKYTLTKIGANHTYDNTDFETAGYDAYVSGKDMWTDGSLKKTDANTGFQMTAKDQDGSEISGLNRLYYESTGVDSLSTRPRIMANLLTRLFPARLHRITTRRF